MSIAVYYFLIQIRKTLSFLIDFKLMQPHGWSTLISSSPLTELVILFYTCTVIYGRLYLGMHSIMGEFIALTSRLCCWCFNRGNLCTWSIGLWLILGANASMAGLLRYVQRANMPSPFIDLCTWVSLFGYSAYSTGALPLLWWWYAHFYSYMTVVCFVGAFLGVAIGNWRTNNYFYEDMERLDMVLRRLTSILPSELTWRMSAFWNFMVLRSVRGRLVASLIFCTFLYILTAAIAPLVAWKVCATPILKTGIPRSYRICKRFIIQRLMGKMSITDSLRLRTQVKSQKGHIRDSKKTTMKPECTLHCTSEERFCIGMSFVLTLDAPRLIIYIGVGFMGATFSHYLINYYDVKLFKLIV